MFKKIVVSIILFVLTVWLSVTCENILEHTINIRFLSILAKSMLSASFGIFMIKTWRKQKN